jgi:hypothetical protein
MVRLLRTWRGQALARDSHPGERRLDHWNGGFSAFDTSEKGGLAGSSQARQSIPEDGDA